MRKGAGKLVLREHAPRRELAVRIALGVLTLLLLWLTATVAYRAAGHDNRELVDERDTLSLRLAEAQAETRRLRERVAILERAVQISRDAETQTRRDLTERDRTLADLRAELAFYESLVAAGNEAQGLQVHSLELAPGPAGTWTFQLTLTHDAREAPEARGRVEWAVEGLRDDAMQRLSGMELGFGNGDGHLEYAFKYFQIIRGDLKLPADFVPRRVEVRLVPADGDAAAVGRSFEWRQVQDEGEARDV